MDLLSYDIHNHILPGVDDGFQIPEKSLKALTTLSEHGCRKIVFTPHINPDVNPKMNESIIRARYDEFKQMIPADLGIETALAAEYMVVRNFEQRATDPELLTYSDKSILIEMSYYYYSDNLEKTIFALNVAGYNPILAHPERYLYMANELQEFRHLKDMGCRFQLNYMSLSGAYGPASMHILTHLMKNGWYDFICTDLHTNHQLESILSIKLDRSLRKAVEKFLETHQQ